MVRGKPLSFDRDEVLDKAMALFWQKGFKHTSMSELLEHMGIQRQSFYNTFGSKEQIFLEAVALYARHLSREIMSMLERSGNPLENVRQVMAMLMEMVVGADASGCLLGNTIAEFGLNHPEISALMKDKVGRLQKAFARAFAKAIEQGLLPASKDPTAMGQSLVVMIQGMALLSKLGFADEMVSGVMKIAEEMMTV